MLGWDSQWGAALEEGKRMGVAGDTGCCRELKVSKQTPSLQSPDFVLGSKNLFLG